VTWPIASGAAVAAPDRPDIAQTTAMHILRRRRLGSSLMHTGRISTGAIDRAR
jgi:hypothetical protein